MTSLGAVLVLVVEDEPAIADLLRSYLQRDGFEVAVSGDGPGALDTVRRRRPAAIILDVGLPGMDGTQVCRQLRDAGDWTPVLFVTARDDEVDRVLGLELGADDYVTKPFSPREVVARVRAVLRRREPVPAGAALQVGGLVLDPATRTVSGRRAHPDGSDGSDGPDASAGAGIELTTTEFDLLHYLMARPGRVCPRDELLSQVWGYPEGTPTRTVDVHIAQLRAKLGDAARLRTVRGVGYAVQP